MKLALHVKKFAAFNLSLGRSIRAMINTDLVGSRLWILFWFSYLQPRCVFAKIHVPALLYFDKT